MPQRMRYSRRTGFGAMLLVLLLTIAIALILYFGKFGGGGQSYVQKNLSAKERAKHLAIDANLSSIHRSLQVYAAGNEGKFPATPEILAREANLPQGFILLPSRPDQEHFAIYVSGQSQSMPASNILIYQAEVGNDGSCQVLRLGGQIERLSPDQVREALDQTQRSLNK